MKPKVIFLSFLIFARTLICLGQTDTQVNVEDEEMNLFLMTLLLVAMGVMIGAGLIVTFLIVAILLLIFSLIAFGILSTSIGIAIYNRSISSGFKSFFLILLTLASGITGIACALIINEIFQLHNNNLLLASIGFISGALGGILLSLATFKILRYLLNYLKLKFIN